MVSQIVYVQYEYSHTGYFLPSATITIHSMTGPVTCESSFDGTSTGCTFDLQEGWIYDATVEKEGYKTNGDSSLANFIAPVDPYILLWLYPCEPTVVTHDATEITATSAMLNGELTDLDGIDATDVSFLYGKVGESFTSSTEWTYYSTDTYSYEITGLAPDTTYNFKTRANNMTEEDTFYVFGETREFTTLPTTEPPVVFTYDTDEITSTGALLRGFLGTTGGILTDIGFEYGTTTSYGTSVWTEASTSPGYYTKAITGLSPNTPYHVRAIASNAYGTGYGVDKGFTTLELTEGVHIMLPNANGKLFLIHTIIACDDPAKACTEFRFLIMNNGDVTTGAWYTVSIVGGATLYSGTVPDLAPGVESSYIEDWICALPDGLPVGTHTITVEVGPEGMAATDSYSESIFVIEDLIYDIQISLYPTLIRNATIVEGDPIQFRTFKVRNKGDTSIYGWYTLTSVDLGISVEGFVGPLAIGANDLVHISNQATAAGPGTYDITLIAGPSTTGDWVGALPFTYSHTEQLTITGWATDITFIATAPSISDLHDVDVTDITDPGNPLYLGKT